MGIVVSGAVRTIVAITAGAALGAGLMLVRGASGDRAAIPPSTAVAPPVPTTLLDEVAERVRREYVENLPPADLDRAAVEGIVARLDPHSHFLDAAEYQAMRVSTSGQYSGVGLEVAEEDGRIVVASPIEGSPAERAGVRTGDVLLAIDGEDLRAGGLDQAVERMRGQTGSTVRLVIARDGEPEPLGFELERSEVHVHTASSARLPGSIGYLRITHFNDETPRDVGQLLADLQGAGPLRGLVLDLRGNPGGVLESAVSVADDFLDDGLIVRAEGRAAGARFEMRASDGDMLGNAPIVVLVDRGSASGSEIVAGALRDHRRATLMGERTFGKGSVQTVIPLSGGQALKLTTSRYFTPSGASIHGRGLEPDVRLALIPLPAGASQPEPAADPAVRAALQYLRDRALGTHVARAGEH
jgi:carboxyl-terminal processing protease